MKIITNENKNCSTVPSPIEIFIKNEIHEDVSYEIEENSSFDYVSPCGELDESTIEASEVLQCDSNGGISEASKTEFRCLKCSTYFNSLEQLNIHKSGHENGLKCMRCTTILKTFKSYEKHVTKCKPFECNVCGRIIRFRPNLIKHIRTHNNLEHEQNSTMTLTARKLNRSTYQCDYCGKQFTNWEYFKIHLKTHTEAVNLTCDICCKEFSALACLREHQKVHTGEKPFRCNICGKTFGQSYNLKIHFRCHSGEKPYECNICGHKMNTSAGYSAHIKTHKNFKCSICNETFNQKLKYMSHMSIHETGKILQCEMCGKKFGRLSNFYNHHRRHLSSKLCK